jgi:hypothetical protein
VPTIGHRMMAALLCGPRRGMARRTGGFDSSPWERRRRDGLGKGSRRSVLGARGLGQSLGVAVGLTRRLGVGSVGPLAPSLRVEVRPSEPPDRPAGHRVRRRDRSAVTGQPGQALTTGGGQSFRSFRVIPSHSESFRVVPSHSEMV